MIAQFLAVNARTRADLVAVEFGARRLAYGELAERSWRLAGALAAAGVGRGDRVATLLHNCPAFIESLFACAGLGALLVPFNFRLVERELCGLLEASTPRALIVGRDFAPLVAALRASPHFPALLVEADDRLPETAARDPDCGYEALLAVHPPREPEHVADADAPQMLLHSSGTTGLPKGAVFTHGTSLASSMAKIIDFSLSGEDAAVVFGPLFHAGPLMDLTLPLLLRGGRIVLGPSRRFDPTTLLATIAARRGSVAPIYPTMLRRVVRLPDLERHDLSSLRLMITGGEPVPVPVLEAVLRRLPDVDLVNNYGSTEGGPITTWLAPADARRKMGSVGKPSFSVDLRIVGEDGRRLGPGEVGEVVVRSPYVCRGYWNRPEATAAALRDGWWHTGDLAWRDAEDFLWIAGRSKDMVKSGTENIFPVEVEQVIAALDGVVENAVIGVPDEEWGETVAAYVVAEPGSGLDAARVIAHCRELLAGYKKPRHVLFVDELPRNTTNKVDKAALRARFAGRLKGDALIFGPGRGAGKEAAEK